MTRPPRGHRPATRLRLVAASIALLGTGVASAADIDLDNHPDIKLRWDNTVRYNLGMRVESPDSRLIGSSSYDEGDSRFKKGQIVTDRLDILSELDFAYRGNFGVRVAAAGWYDNAYENHNVTAPAGTGTVPTSYFDNSYNGKVKRYVNGPSGEFLDAFVWGNFNLGSIPVNVKAGRHALVWGEGLLIGAQAISYSQAPTDGVKAVASPGIETKEVFLPLNQLSFKAQLSTDISIMGQYALQWEPTRAPNGGTYLMGADTSPNVDRLGIAPGVSVTNVAALQPGKTGNWGVGMRWDVEPIDSTLGFYYRKFNDYNPETGIQFLSFTQLVPGNAATTVPTTFRFVYPKDVRIIGMSLARSLGPVSFGSELSLRQNGQLNSKTTYLPTQNTGARGDTWHFVANGTYLLPKTPVWDTGTLIVELAHAHLIKITENPELYRGVGNAAACIKSGGTTLGNISDACSTRDFTQIAANFAPQWLSILPSWDLTLPTSINYGLKGTSPTGSGGFEKLLTWSVGSTMVYQSKYEFSLRYSDTSVPTKYDANNHAIGGNSLGSTVGATDRGWVVFTFKTSF